MVRDAKEYERELDLQVRQRSDGQGFFVGLHNSKFFAVPPAKSLLLFVLVLSIWNDIESIYLYLVCHLCLG